MYVKKYRNYKYLLFVLPALAYVAILSFFPAASVVFFSFKSSRGVYSLSNYTAIVQAGLLNSIIHTVIVSFGALLIQLFFAMLIANILIKSLKGNKFFSTVFIIPYGVATVVSAFIFALIFSPVGGFANSTLHSLGIQDVNWYSNIYSSMGVVMFADFWKNTPLVALILLGGLSSIPPSMNEAASVDGAGPLRRFIYITLPNLAPFIAIALLIRGVSEFNIFALPLILIGYHPSLINTLVYEYFNSISAVGYSYAAATVLLLIILVFAFVIIKFGGTAQYEK
ncbi:MAG TPA: sugar ABC transporter permease [Ferroplasma sp.]|jgi:ABC-type sugar transport system permease subunit|nr:sugar ABC transporter permease [Ferroplasma sp.]